MTDAREDLEAGIKLIMDQYRGGKMTIVPNYFPHYTPCCGRRYETTEYCETSCPYECGSTVNGDPCQFCEVLKRLWTSAGTPGS